MRGGLVKIGVIKKTPPLPPRITAVIRNNKKRSPSSSKRTSRAISSATFGLVDFPKSSFVAYSPSSSNLDSQYCTRTPLLVEWRGVWRGNIHLSEHIVKSRGRHAGLLDLDVGRCDPSDGARGYEVMFKGLCEIYSIRVPSRSRCLGPVEDM